MRRGRSTSKLVRRAQGDKGVGGGKEEDARSES